ncbi:hypothetical protein [Haloarcula marina]|uniref:hypothetical protein n=1 Tax=Haloarcula marina TaxID=2961574 RepID=UPI0020B65D62|nr:hypothetical protein [Halomicroarcula marina]
MTDETDADEERVAVSMEITGSYDEVMSKLDTTASAGPSLGPLNADVERLLETVVRINGGTRSAIAEQLPADMSVAFDAEAVVETMQVLERYGLVVLEGNTWKPGPELER